MLLENNMHFFNICTVPVFKVPHKFCSLSLTKTTEVTVHNKMFFVNVKFVA